MLDTFTCQASIRGCYLELCHGPGSIHMSRCVSSTGFEVELSFSLSSQYFSLIHIGVNTINIYSVEKITSKIYLTSIFRAEKDNPRYLCKSDSPWRWSQRLGDSTWLWQKPQIPLTKNTKSHYLFDSPTLTSESWELHAPLHPANKVLLHTKPLFMAILLSSNDYHQC